MGQQCTDTQQCVCKSDWEVLAQELLYSMIPFFALGGVTAVTSRRLDIDYYKGLKHLLGKLGMSIEPLEASGNPPARVRLQL